MKDVVQFSWYVHIVAYIVVVKGEIRKAQEVFQIFHIPCDEVVHGEDFVAFGDESITQM
jgi:hypothetical protein